MYRRKRLAIRIWFVCIWQLCLRRLKVVCTFFDKLGSQLGERGSINRVSDRVIEPWRNLFVSAARWDRIGSKCVKKKATADFSELDIDIWVARYGYRSLNFWLNKLL
jgi:hypothetical protein